MILRHVDAFHEVVCFLEVFFCFAAHAHYHVHTNEGMGHHLAYLVYFAAEECRVIVAVHDRQHFVASAL